MRQKMQSLTGVARLSGGMDGDLERWAADARAREAADARVRERWLRAQAAEEASLAGVLLALAERRGTVAGGPGRRGGQPGRRVAGPGRATGDGGRHHVDRPAPPGRGDGGGRRL